jgi:hypothetical protein
MGRTNYSLIKPMKIIFILALFKPNYQYADHTAQAQENKLTPYDPNLTMLATTEKVGASNYGRLNVQHQRGRWPSLSCRSAARALRAAREVTLDFEKPHTTLKISHGRGGRLLFKSKAGT